MSLRTKPKKERRIDHAAIEAIAAGEQPKPKAEKKPRKKRRQVDILKDKADDAVGAACRTLGRCEAEGYAGIVCSNRFEWAHVVSRGILFLRHDPRNYFCLCNLHHRHFTERPNAWYSFVESARPGTWDYLRNREIDRKETPVKVPLEEIYRDAIARVQNLTLEIPEAA